MATTVRYDEAVITRFARALDRRARALEIGYTILGAVLVDVGAAAVAMWGPGVDPRYVVPVALLGGAVGWLKAQGPASGLRLQAQTALCQAQIERNTRSTAVHAAAIAATLVAARATGDDRGAAGVSIRPVELDGREPPTQRERRGAAVVAGRPEAAALEAVQRG